ncbi:MAG: hypothetical protein ACYC1M_14600 [Armatimonadota bacterium]
MDDIRNVKTLFLKTLDDLCLSIHEHDHYEMTRASGLLRQLLLDGNDLVSFVNREYHLKLQFEVVPFVSNPLPDIGDYHQVPTEAIDPSCERGRDTVSLNRGQFIECVIGDLMGTPCRVKDIIKYVANSAGGVHYGTDNDKVQSYLHEIQSTRLFQGYDFILQVVRAIGRICLKALRPLRDKIVQMERFTDVEGIDIILSVMPLKQESDDLYLLDIGSSPASNRIALYIDQADRLTVRIVYADGRIQQILAGRSGCIYSYGSPSIIELRVVRYQQFMLIDVGSSVWSFIDIAIEPDVVDVALLDHCVIGSDFFGQKHTHMRLFDVTIAFSLMTHQERNDLINQYNERLLIDQHNWYYCGNQFVYSVGHPYHPH